MKKILITLTLISALACKENKIGFVDNQKLMNEYQEKMDVETRIKAKADALTKMRDSISQSFQNKFAVFQAKAQKMPETQAQKEYSQIQQEGQIISQQLQEQEQQLQQENQTETDSVISKVKREIKSYGKANGYAYILGGGDGGTVLYGDKSQDITAPLVKALNDNYKK